MIVHHCRHYVEDICKVLTSERTKLLNLVAGKKSIILSKIK